MPQLKTHIVLVLQNPVVESVDSASVDSAASMASTSMVVLHSTKPAGSFCKFETNADSLIHSNFNLQTADSLTTSLHAPYGFEGSPLTFGFERSAGVQSILLVSLLLTLVSLSIGYRYYEQLFRNFFKVQDRAGAFVENSAVGFEFKGILAIQALILESLLSYSLIGRLVFHTGAVSANLVGIGLFALAFLVYHLFRVAVISFLGFTFSDTRMLRSYISEYFSFLALWGLFLLPIALCLLYWSVSPILIAIILVASVFVSRVSYLNKGVKIFFIQSRSIFYIILYLCALEIVPLAALFQAMVYIYSFSF